MDNLHYLCIGFKKKRIVAGGGNEKSAEIKFLIGIWQSIISERKKRKK